MKTCINSHISFTAIQNLLISMSEPTVSVAGLASASSSLGGFNNGGWFEVAVLKSDGTPIAQHRWRRKAILSLKPGANKTCDSNVIQELLRQYRESGTIRHYDL